jgi:hypothetical protein
MNPWLTLVWEEKQTGIEKNVTKTHSKFLSTNSVEIKD